MRILILLAAFCGTAHAQPRYVVDPFSPPPPRYGAEEKAALQRCPKQVADKLAAFIQTGSLDWFPRPADALKAVAKIGPAAAEFVMANATELRDPDAFDAFIDDAEAVVYGRATLSEAVASRREKREAGWRPRLDKSSAFIGGVGMLCGFLLACATFRRGPKTVPAG